MVVALPSEGELLAPLPVVQSYVGLFPPFAGAIRSSSFSTRKRLFWAGAPGARDGSARLL
jgi:hypothetical protein